MNFCPKCGQAVEEDMKHCEGCGAAVNQPEPVYPIAAKPAISVKARVLGYVGLGVSIDGLILGIVSLLYVMVLFLVSLAIYLGGDVGVGFITTMFAWFMGIFAFPCCIVGRMLCKKSMKEGNTSRACSIGSKLGLAGLILSVIMVVLGLVSLMFI